MEREGEEREGGRERERVGEREGESWGEFESLCESLHKYFQIRPNCLECFHQVT